MSAQTITLQPPKGWLPAQAEATRLIEQGKGVTHVLLSGGMGSGKSYWLAVEAFRLHFTNLQWARQRGVNPSSVKGGLLVPTYDLLMKGMRPTLLEAAYDLGIHDIIQWKQSERTLSFNIAGVDCGHIMSFTADAPERLIAANLSYGLVDEPGTPRSGEALARLSGRLRGPGCIRRIAMAGTPEDILARAWFYDMIASPEAQREYGPSGRNSRHIVYASTGDNFHIADLEGFLSGMRQTYSEAQQAAYIEGRFVTFAEGRAYAGFIDRSVDLGGNLIPTGHDLLQPPRKPMPVYLTLDFNVSPMCGLIALRRGDHGIVVVDEIRIPNAGREGRPAINLACDEFKRRCEEGLGYEGWPSLPVGAVEIYGDATERRVTAAASRSGWDIVHNEIEPWARERGQSYYPQVPYANPAEADRVNILNAAFQQGRVLVSERCAHLRRDLNLVTIKEGTNRLDKTDPDLTHLSDALGYLVYARSPTVDPTPSRQSESNAMSSRREPDPFADWGHEVPDLDW